MSQHIEQFRPFFRGKRVLITGGAGFIGSHLASTLLRLDAKVVVLDDLSSGNRENLPRGAEFIHASVTDQAAVDAVTAGCDTVFHEAAMVSVPQSVERPDDCLMRNVVGTQRVLGACHAAKVRRFVQAVSAAAYGANPSLPSRETDPPDPRSPYAASKLAAEHLARSAWATTGVSAVSLRYFNVYGPRQDPKSPYAAAICAFHDRLKAGRAITIFGDGKQTRDFVHVSDVVRANLLAATCPGDIGGMVMNIGTGHRSTLLDVVGALAAGIGVTPRIEFGAERAGDVRDSVADISLAQSALGYAPTVDLKTGLGALVKE